MRAAFQNTCCRQLSR